MTQNQYGVIFVLNFMTEIKEKETFGIRENIFDYTIMTYDFSWVG